MGTVFRALRRRALDGDAKKAAWFEFSVDKIGDVKDPARWAATNPALGRRIQLSTIEGEVEQLDPDTFAGNVWAGGAGGHPAAGLALTLAGLWAACSEEQKPRANRLRHQVCTGRQRGLSVRRGAAKGRRCPRFPD